jgi:hypothetical protein
MNASTTIFSSRYSNAEGRSPFSPTLIVSPVSGSISHQAKTG